MNTPLEPPADPIPVEYRYQVTPADCDAVRLIVESTGFFNPAEVGVAVELVEKYPRAFSADFENNKVLVQRLTNCESIMMRNRIAGYISRYWQNKDF